MKISIQKILYCSSTIKWVFSIYKAFISCFFHSRIYDYCFLFFLRSKYIATSFIIDSDHPNYWLLGFNDSPIFIYDRLLQNSSSPHNPSLFINLNINTRIFSSVWFLSLYKMLFITSAESGCSCYEGWRGR